MGSFYAATRPCQRPFVGRQAQTPFVYALFSVLVITGPLVIGWQLTSQQTMAKHQRQKYHLRVLPVKLPTNYQLCADLQVFG